METDSSIRMKCPSCGAVGRGKDSYLNREIKCPKCGKVVRFIRVDLPHALGPIPVRDYHAKVINEKRGPKKKTDADKMRLAENIGAGAFGTKKLLGIIGAIVMFIGVFMPIVSIPIMGNMNYFQNGEGDGTIVLILAGISLVLVLAGKFKGLWFTGFGSLGIMLFTFINFQTKMSQVKADMESKLADNPFRGLAQVAMQSVQLQWGWAVLIVGAALVIASAAMKDEPK